MAQAPLSQPSAPATPAGSERKPRAESKILPRPPDELTFRMLSLFCVADALAHRLRGVPGDQVNEKLQELIDQRTRLSAVTERTQLLVLYYTAMRSWRMTPFTRALGTDLLYRWAQHRMALALDDVASFPIDPRAPPTAACPFLSLPSDVILLVLQRLDAVALGRIARVCKKLRNLSLCDAAWQALNDYRTPPPLIRVTCDFQRENDGQVSVNVGELLPVVERADDGWHTVISTTGEQGEMPSKYGKDLTVPSPLPEAYALAKTERARFLLRRELAAIPDRYHLNVGPLPEFMDTPLMSQHGVMTCGQLRGLLSLQRLVRPIWSFLPALAAMLGCRSSVTHTINYERCVTNHEDYSLNTICNLATALCGQHGGHLVAPAATAPFASLPPHVLAGLRSEWDVFDDASLQLRYDSLPKLQELRCVPDSDLSHIANVAGGVVRAFIEGACMPLPCLRATLSLPVDADRRDATTLMAALLALAWRFKPKQLAPLLALAPPDWHDLIVEIKKIPLPAPLRMHVLLV